MAVVAAGLVGIETSIVPSATAEPQTAAADLSQFQPGNIIADELFFNPNTMNEAQIQAFLNLMVPTCSPGYTCLKDYRQNTFTIAATPMCSEYTGAANESAATIIYRVAQSCGISPKVLLVTLQKEQSLVTSTSPSAGKYAAAMGAGCPDTAPCDANYRSFFQQVQYGAYLFKRYTQPPGTGPGTEYTTRFDLRYPVGQTTNVLYYPTSRPYCGTRPVYIANQATHALYIYTPYTPNQAALNAGYGLGDDCSTYGNRNFFNFYTDWFGSTQVPEMTTTGAVALGTPEVGQTLNGSPGTVTPRPDTVTCTWTRGTTAIPEATDCLYSVTSADLGQTLTVTVTSTRAGYKTLTQTSPPTAVIENPPAPVDGFNALDPARLAETRTTPSEHTFDARVQGTGALTAGQVLQVPVLGRAGVPATGVGAVVLNVTAVNPSTTSFLTVYPSGSTRPRTSNVNFTARQTIANAVVAQVGTDGAISVYNSDGSTNVIVDIVGWLPAVNGITPVGPARIAETRNAAGEGTIDGQVQGGGALSSGQVLNVPVAGRAGVPATGVGAVVLNVTAVNPTAASFLTVYPSGATRPRTSNVNFAARQTVANTVVAQLGPDGAINVVNSDGSTHVIVDVVGWLPATGFSAVGPARIAETRSTPGEGTTDGQVQGGGALAAGQVLTIPVLGRVGVPASGVGAVVLNVTATAPTATGFLTVYPTGATRPWTSNVNFTAKQTIANTVIAHVAPDGSISVYNSDGRTHVVVDIVGWLPGG